MSQDLDLVTQDVVDDGDVPTPRARRSATPARPPRSRRSRRPAVASVDEEQVPELRLDPAPVDPIESTPPPAPVGRRTAASRERRRRERSRWARDLVLGVGIIAVVTLVAVLVRMLGGDTPGGDEDGTITTSAAVFDLPGGAQPTMTVVTVAPGARGERLASVVVLTMDRLDGRATALLVPTATVADVPGHGTFHLADAFDFGGATLVGVSVDQLLGIRVDEIVTVTTQSWSALVDALGGVEVTLASPLVRRGAQGGEVLVPEGTSHLSASAFTPLMVASDSTPEMEAMPRLQAAWQGLLDRWLVSGDTPGAAVDDARLGTSFAGGDVTVVRELLDDLAEARRTGDLTTLTLPVSPFDLGDGAGYRVDAERVATLVAERLAGARPEGDAAGGRTLQVLNGNGVPGIGAAVAEALQPASYRVLLTGNADRFDHAVTRIVVYDEAPETLAAARDIRDRLGVGQIERSGTPQSVVDITIVVGRDFTRR